MARRSFTPLLIAVLAVSACTDPTSLAPTESSSALRLLPAPPPEPGRYLVGFDGAPSISADVMAAAGGRIVDSIPSMNILIVDGVTNPTALYSAQPKYIDAGFDLFAEPIATDVPAPESAESVPGQETTPWFQSGVEWDMKTIHAEEGWAMTNGGLGINACIVDTGVDDQHQELNGGKVILRANFVAGESRVDDPHGHGSHVASNVAARGIVISGVAPRANIMSARVLNAAGSGQEAAIFNGINWCTANGAHVINMSLGGARYKGTAAFTTSPNAYGAAIAAANAAGAVVIVSAGNSNLKLPNLTGSQITVPSQVAGVINVGATGPLSNAPAVLAPAWNPFDPSQVRRSVDNKAYYSNYGTGVQVFAPGGRGNVPLSEVYRFVGGVSQGGPYDQIYGVCSGQSTQSGPVNVGGAPASSASCTNNTSRYIAYAGTSQAAPHVSGLAVLLYEELGGVRSAANRARVENCIRTTTDNIGDPSMYGGGRINVKKAIDALRANSC